MFSVNNCSNIICNCMKIPSAFHNNTVVETDVKGLGIFEIDFVAYIIV